MSESLPPAGLRNGNWMVDLTMERLADQSRYVNQVDVWSLPRRLRIDTTFKMDRDSDNWQDHNEQFLRPMRTGALGLALKTDLRSVVITTPDDLDALERAICNQREWSPFDQSRKEAPHGRPRFLSAELSDKGRYLLGVLQLFDSLPDAFSVLMDGFWRDVLHGLGASAIDKNPELPDSWLKRFEDD